MRNAFDKLISRLGMAKERISELEGISIETFKTENQREQTEKYQNRLFKDCGIATKGVSYK